MTLVQILTLPFPSWVMLGKSHHLWWPQGPHPHMNTKYVPRKMIVAFARDNVPKATGTCSVSEALMIEVQPRSTKGSLKYRQRQEQSLRVRVCVHMFVCACVHVRVCDGVF